MNNQNESNSVALIVAADRLYAALLERANHGSMVRDYADAWKRLASVSAARNRRIREEKKNEN